jgi:hypothetical protein
LEEKLLANHNVYECTDEARLTRWLANVERELARREAAANAPAYATTTQREEITRLLNHPAVTRPQKTNVLLRINRLDTVQAEELLAKLRALTTPAAAVVVAQPLTEIQVVRLPIASVKTGYMGSTSDRSADLSDRRLEDWHIRETGLSYADLARL